MLVKIAKSEYTLVEQGCKLGKNKIQENFVKQTTHKKSLKVRPSRVPCLGLY